MSKESGSITFIAEYGWGSTLSGSFDLDWMDGLAVRDGRMRGTDRPRTLGTTLITRPRTQDLRDEVSMIKLYLGNRTPLPRLEPSSWFNTYCSTTVKQAIRLLTSIPCCIYEPTTKFRQPTTIVTGGLGYVGSHVCLELLQRGYTVLIIDNLANSYADTMHKIGLALDAARDHRDSEISSSKMLHIPLDYGDADALDRVFSAYSRHLQILGAIHLAASKSVAESLKNPWKYYDNNVVKMERFLRVLRSHGVENVIFASSATVYGSLPSNKLPKVPLTEDMVPPLDPNLSPKSIVGIMRGLTPYGISKRLGEALVERFTAQDTKRRAVIYRLFNPVGCDPYGFLRENPRDDEWCGKVELLLRRIIARGGKGMWLSQSVVCGRSNES